MKKLLILKGYSQYNVLRIAADVMAAGFQKLGYRVKVIGFEKETDFEEAIMDIISDYDLIFSFQALLFEYKLQDNTYLFNNTATPVFGFIVDHPSYHHTRLSAELNSNVHVGCIDQGHVKYILKYYPGIKNVSYIPHAGFEPKERTPYKDRDIDIFFPGTYSPVSSSVEAINQLPDVFRSTALKLIEFMQRDRSLTLEKALELYFNNIQFDCSIKEFRELMVMLLPVDGYIRSYYRDLCINTLLRNGIHVTVAGNGWKDYETIYLKHFHLLSDKGMDIDKVVDLCSRSKIVLNVMPVYKEGLHERIMTAMHSNAVSLTDTSKRIEIEFENNENIALYDLNNIDELPSIVNNLLQDEKKASDIAFKGYSIAAEKHKWFDRAKDILSICLI